jgi:acyl carrier protein
MDRLLTIRAIIAQSLNKPISEIGAQSDLIQDLGASSFEIVEIVMALEDAFPHCNWSLPMLYSTAQDIAAFIDTNSDS